MADPITFDPSDPVYSQYQKAAMAGALANIVNKQNQTKMLSDALGPQSSSGAFGTLPPEAMMGLSPDQVSSVAKDRSTQALQQMMTNMHALDFAKTMTGQAQSDALEQKNLEGGNEKDIAAMRAVSMDRVAAAQVRAQSMTGAETMSKVMAANQKAVQAWEDDPINTKRPGPAAMYSTPRGKEIMDSYHFMQTYNQKVKNMSTGALSPEDAQFVAAINANPSVLAKMAADSSEYDKYYGDGKAKTPPANSLPDILLNAQGTKGKDRYTDASGTYDWNYQTNKWEHK